MVLVQGGIQLLSAQGLNGLRIAPHLPAWLRANSAPTDNDFLQTLTHRMQKKKKKPLQN